MIGEIHILHDGLIANSRRDNFEQNKTYFQLAEELQECAATITKELRKLSYERSLSSAKKAVVEAAIADDVNGLRYQCFLAQMQYNAAHVL